MELFILDGCVHVIWLCYLFIYFYLVVAACHSPVSLFLVCRPQTCPSHQGFSLALPFSSFPHFLPLIFTLCLPRPSINRSILLCVCFTAFSCVLHIFTYCIPPSPPMLTVGMSGHSILYGQSRASICLWPVHLTKDSVAWRHKICVCVNIILLLFIVTCNSLCPCVLYIMLIIGM